MDPKKKPSLRSKSTSFQQSYSPASTSSTSSTSSLEMNLPNDINQEVAALSRFRRGLRREDQIVFDQLMTYIENHRASCKQVEHLLSIETLLFTLLLEQQKQINDLLSRSQSDKNFDIP